MSEIFAPTASKHALTASAGKPAEVLATVQALLGDGKLNFTVEHDRRRGVGMKHVEAQDQHELRLSPLTSHVWLDHSFRLGSHWMFFELH